MNMNGQADENWLLRKEPQSQLEAALGKRELANNLEITDALNIADHLSRGQYDWCPEAEWVLRAQYDKIKTLEASVKRQDLVIQSLNNLMTAQDNKITDLAWKLGYVERSNELLREEQK